MNNLLNGFKLAGKFLFSYTAELLHHFTEGYGDKNKPAKSARAIAFWSMIAESAALVVIFILGSTAYLAGINMKPFAPFLLISVIILATSLAVSWVVVVLAEIDC